MREVKGGSLGKERGNERVRERNIENKKEGRKRNAWKKGNRNRKIR